MSLPEKRIKKITLPGDVSGSKTYEIVPEKLGKNSHSAELPTLTEDSTIALTKDLPHLITLDAANGTPTEVGIDWTLTTDQYNECIDENLPVNIRVIIESGTDYYLHRYSVADGTALFSEIDISNDLVPGLIIKGIVANQSGTKIFSLVQSSVVGNIVGINVGLNGYTPTDGIVELPVIDIDSLGYVLANNTYSSSSTYNVGAIVYYNGYIYECTTAVSSPEDFDYSKWTSVSVQALIDRKHPIIDSNNKLWSDYINDEGNATVHKFVTWEEKEKIAALGTASTKNTGTSAGNVPILDSNGKLDTNVLPAIAVSETFTAANQAAMLALTAQVGDICVRTDETKTYILVKTPASTLANWKLLEHPADAVSSVNGKTGAVSLSYSDVSAASSTHKHSYTPAGTVSLGSNDTATDGVAYIASVSSAGASGSATTRYLHKSTTNVAPNSHTHTVTVSGTSGKNSGSAVSAVTGYPDFSGGSLGGTKTFVTGVSGGSGGLESYDAATGGTKKVSNGTRIPYVTAQGTITGASYTPAGSVSLTNGTAPSMGAATTKYLSAAPSHTSTTSGNNSGTKVVAVTGYPNFSGGSLTGTKTFVTGVSGGSGKLEAYDAETSGTKKVANGTRIPFITSASHTAASLGTASTGTVSISGGSYSGTTRYMKVTTTAAGTGTVGISGGSGSLEAYDAATNGTKTVSNGTRIPFVTSASHTAASLGTASTGTVGISGGSGTLEAYDAATSGTKVVSDGTRIPYIVGTFNESTGVLDLTTQYLAHSHTAASLTGTKTFVTGYPNFSGGSATHTVNYLAHGHTAASLTGTTTFNTNAIKAVTLSESETSTDGPAYTKSISGSAPSLGGTKTFVTGYPNFDGGSASHTTWYLEHGHTAASSSGSGTVSFTAASLGDPSTGDAAPHTHTHSYDKTTGITLTANDSTATGRITYVQAQGTFSAGTTPKASASFSGTAATITPTLSDPTIYYLAHSHTGASSSGTGTVTYTAASLGTPSTSSVAPNEHTHSYGSSTALTTSANSGSAVAAITGLASNTSSATGDITFLEAYSVSGGTASGTTKYFHPSFTGTQKDTGEPK